MAPTRPDPLDSECAQGVGSGEGGGCGGGASGRARAAAHRSLAAARPPAPGDDLLARVLALLPPPALAAAELACRRWQRLVEERGAWRPHALAAQQSVALQSRALVERPALVPSQADKETQRAARATRAAAAREVQGWKERYMHAQWRRLLLSPGEPQRTLTLRAHSAAVSWCHQLGTLLATASADSVSAWGGWVSVGVGGRARKECGVERNPTRAPTCPPRVRAHHSPLHRPPRFGTWRVALAYCARCPMQRPYSLCSCCPRVLRSPQTQRAPRSGARPGAAA